MENFVPTNDPTQNPVGSLLIISQRPHLTQIVLSLVREQGFDIKASNHVPDSFIIEADLTRALTYSNITEAKDEAVDKWVEAFEWLKEVVEGLPASLCVHALAMTSWDGCFSEWWPNPKAPK